MLLADQDRSLWDTAQIAGRRAVLDRALALQGRGLYDVQAAIASPHATSPRLASDRGPLRRACPPDRLPVVELSRGRRRRRGGWSRGGLDIVDRLALEDYRYLRSTRGELLRRLGRTAEARDTYRRELALVRDDAERRLLERWLAELGTAASDRS